MQAATRRDVEATGIFLGVALGLVLLLGVSAAGWAGLHFFGGWREASVARAALGGTP